MKIQQNQGQKSDSSSIPTEIDFHESTAPSASANI